MDSNTFRTERRGNKDMWREILIHPIVYGARLEQTSSEAAKNGASSGNWIKMTTFIYNYDMSFNSILLQIPI